MKCYFRDRDKGAFTLMHILYIYVQFMYLRAFWRIQNVCTCMYPQKKPLQPLRTWSGQGTWECLKCSETWYVCVPMCLDGRCTAARLQHGVPCPSCLVVRTHSEAQQSEQRCETTERTLLLTQFGKCPVT